MRSAYAHHGAPCHAQSCRLWLRGGCSWGNTRGSTNALLDLLHVDPAFRKQPVPERRRAPPVVPPLLSRQHLEDDPRAERLLLDRGRQPISPRLLPLPVAGLDLLLAPESERVAREPEGVAPGGVEDGLGESVGVLVEGDLIQLRPERRLDPLLHELLALRLFGGPDLGLRLLALLRGACPGVPVELDRGRCTATRRGLAPSDRVDALQLRTS